MTSALKPQAVHKDPRLLPPLQVVGPTAKLPRWDEPGAMGPTLSDAWGKSHTKIEAPLESLAPTMGIIWLMVRAGPSDAALKFASKEKVTAGAVVSAQLIEMLRLFTLISEEKS